MVEFEKGPSREYTPCHFQSVDEIAHALAVIYTELVMIHPFKEGNGRVARMLALGTLAALEDIGAGAKRYFQAIGKRGERFYFFTVRATGNVRSWGTGIQMRRRCIFSVSLTSSASLPGFLSILQAACLADTYPLCP